MARGWVGLELGVINLKSLLHLFGKRKFVLA